MGQKHKISRAPSNGVFGHPSGRTQSVLRVGLYARVSTHDQQTIPLQTRAMREYATRRGWRITLQVKEIGSGASQREWREEMQGAAPRPGSAVVAVGAPGRSGRVGDGAARCTSR